MWISPQKLQTYDSNQYKTERFYTISPLSFSWEDWHDDDISMNTSYHIYGVFLNQGYGFILIENDACLVVLVNAKRWYIKEFGRWTCMYDGYFSFNSGTCDDIYLCSSLELLSLICLGITLFLSS